MSRPEVRGRLRLMASGINTDVPSIVLLGMIEAQKELQEIQALQTLILAKAQLKNTEGMPGLIEHLFSLIECREYKPKDVSEEHRKLMEEMRHRTFKIDLSSIGNDI